MARERDPDEPKIYFLPNLMTACNLACGFFAVLMIFRGLLEVGNATVPPKEYYEHVKPYYEYAILLIFGSCLFDLLDGRLARLGGQESPFGQEFDSLADIISFGMAPAMLLSKAVLFPLGNVGWAIALIYLVCGALRLARFNCLASMPKKPGASTDFRGLPIPMAAGFIASLTFLLIDLHQNDHELRYWKYVLGGAMLGLSLLMISDIRYPSFKKSRPENPRHAARHCDRRAGDLRDGAVPLCDAGGAFQPLSGLWHDPPVAFPKDAEGNRGRGFQR